MEGNVFELEQIRELVLGCNIKCLYITEKEMKLENFSLEDQKLKFQGKEIAVMYFRHYYNEDQFEGDSKEIIAMADASNTIMIPDPFNFLLSLKPIQHLLYSKELMSRYGISFSSKAKPFLDYLNPTYLLKQDFQNDKKKMLEFIDQYGQEKLLLKSFSEGGAGEILVGEAMREFI